MPRDVSVTFGDGSNHVYNNVPDNVTPEQITARAGTDFAGKQVTHLDGGRGGQQGQPPQQAQQPQQAQEPERSLTQRTTDTVKEAAAGVWRGAEKAYEGFGVRALPPATWDPATADQPWYKRKLLYGKQDPQTNVVTYGGAQEPPKQAAPGSWTSAISEFAGEMIGGGPGALGKAGGAAVAGRVGRAAEAVGSALPESIRSRAAQVGEKLGFGAGERANAPVPLFQQGSYEEARAADRALQAGQRTTPISRTERVSAALPGGGPARRAITAAETRGAELTTDQIAANLARGQERVIGTERGAYNVLNNADRAQVAAFWRVGGPDQVFQALTHSGSDPQLLKLVQQATTVLNPGSQRYIASEMLSRMGRGANGTFSAGTFLQNWNRIAPGARDAMFGQRALGHDYARQMSELASNIERIQAYAASTPLQSLRRMIPRRGPMGVAAAALGTVALGGAEGVEAVLHGLLNMGTVSGAVAAGSANWALARALTNPATVRYLRAQSAKMLASYVSAQSNSQFSEMSQ